jgi:uncharacterized protein
MEIGKINTLTVVRKSESGWHLADSEKNEVLLPASFVKQDYRIKDEIEVFIHTDSEGRPIATTLKPAAETGNFAYLKVNEVTDVGAFLDWRIEKDLFVPFSEQRFPMERNDFYVVYIYLDERSKRITASSKIDKFVSDDLSELKGGMEVDLLVYDESPLGFSCIINGKYKGLLYHNDIYQEVFEGDEVKGYIKTIRDDGLIDLSLQRVGFKNILSATDLILENLTQSNGFINLSDKSSPEDIAERFNMSKATFKKSIGVLYRQRKILIKEDGIYLVKENTDKDESAK